MSLLIFIKAQLVQIVKFWLGSVLFAFGCSCLSLRGGVADVAIWEAGVPFPPHGLLRLPPVAEWSRNDTTNPNRTKLLLPSH